MSRFKHVAAGLWAWYRRPRLLFGNRHAGAFLPRLLDLMIDTDGG